jgi:predicted molibdopterin-dependent oxidoreductase YjgC
MLKKKIDNSSKKGMMVGYIHHSSYVVAVEPGWNITPQAMAKLLQDRYSTKEAAIELVESAVLVPVFKKDNYEYVEGFGDVLESNLNFHGHNLRTHVGHLFLFMKGAWQYSDNTVDWDPVSEVFKDDSGVSFAGVRDALGAVA